LTLPTCLDVDVVSYEIGKAYELGITGPGALLTLEELCVSSQNKSEVAILVYNRTANELISVEIELIDFEAFGIFSLPNGEINEKIRIAAFKDLDSDNNLALVFNNSIGISSAVNENFTAFSNFLIIAEDLSSPELGYHEGRGVMEFKFDQPSEVLNFTMLPFTEGVYVVDLYDVKGVLLRSINVSTIVSSGVAETILIGESDVKRMVVSMDGAAGIDELYWKPEPDPCLRGYECFGGIIVSCDELERNKNSIVYDLFEENEYLAMVLANESGKGEDDTPGNFTVKFDCSSEAPSVAPSSVPSLVPSSFPSRLLIPTPPKRGGGGGGGACPAPLQCPLEVSENTTTVLNEIQDKYLTLPTCLDVDVVSYEIGKAYELGITGPGALLTLEELCVSSQNKSEVAILVYNRTANELISVEIELIDFEAFGIFSLPNGEINEKIRIAAFKDLDSDNNLALVFNNSIGISSAVNENFTAFSNFLIIAEDLSSPELGYHEGRGVMEFKFDQPSEVLNFTMLPFTEGVYVVDLYDVKGVLLRSINVSTIVSSGVAETILIGESDVKRMVVSMDGAAGIDELYWKPEPDPCLRGYECFGGIIVSCDELERNKNSIVYDLFEENEYLAMVLANESGKGEDDTPGNFTVKFDCSSEAPSMAPSSFPSISTFGPTDTPTFSPGIPLEQPRQCSIPPLSGRQACNETVVGATGQLGAVPSRFSELPVCKGVNVSEYAHFAAYEIMVSAENAKLTLASACVNAENFNDVSMLLFKRFLNVTTVPGVTSTVGFENFNKGEVVGTMEKGDNITVEIQAFQAGSSLSNVATIIDGSNSSCAPEGFLFRSQKNMLIIADDPTDEKPTPHASGGRIEFSFSRPLEVIDLVLINLQGENNRVELFDESENLVATGVVGSFDGRQRLLMNRTDVSQIVITLTGEGAVDDLRCRHAPDPCVDGYECVDGYLYDCDDVGDTSNSILYDLLEEEIYLAVVLGNVQGLPALGDIWSIDVDCRLQGSFDRRDGS